MTGYWRRLAARNASRISTSRSVAFEGYADQLSELVAPLDDRLLRCELRTAVGGDRALLIERDRPTVEGRTARLEARHVDEPLEVGSVGDRRFEQVHRPLRVALEEVGLGPRLHEAGGMHDRVDALHRPIDGSAVFHAPLGELDVLQGREELAVRALANERDHGVAGCRELLRDVTTEEPGAARNENLHRRLPCQMGGRDQAPRADRDPWQLPGTKREHMTEGGRPSPPARMAERPASGGSPRAILP